MNRILFCVLFTSVVQVTGNQRPLVGPSRDQNPPEIHISRWMIHDDEDYQYRSWTYRFGNPKELVNMSSLTTNVSLPDEIIQKDNSTYVILENIEGVTFTCFSSYPIHWVNEEPDELAMSYGVHIRKGKSVRIAGNVSDPTTFQYQSNLEFVYLSSLSGGYYSCQSVEEPTIDFRRIFIYFEGSRDTYFPESEINHFLTIGVNGHKEIILPCYTSLPDLPVVLYKRLLEEAPGLDIVQEYIEIPTQNIPEVINFNSIDGYTINVPLFKAIHKTVLGQYKCMANDTYRGDHLLITVVEEHDRYPQVKEYIRDNASFILIDGHSSDGHHDYYQGPQHSVQCCSSSSKQPLLLTVWCFDPMPCAMFKPQYWSFNRTQELAIHGNGYLNDSCVYNYVYPSETTIVGCFGDGVSVIKTLYSTPLLPGNNHDYNTYIGWDEVKPEEMVNVIIQKCMGPEQLRQVVGPEQWRQVVGLHRTDLDDNLIYSGQIIRVECHPSRTYYADGHHWQLKWKNGTVTTLQHYTTQVDLSRHPEYYTYDSELRKQLAPDFSNFTAQFDILMVTCLAPVWNSSKWIEKSTYLNITPSTLNPLECTHESTWYWALGSSDVGFECKLRGDPMPEMTILKDGKRLQYETGFDVTAKSDMNESSISLLVPMVFHDAQGVYTIIGENFGGTVEATFVVFVYEPVNWTAIIIVTIMVITGIIGLVIVIWKARSQKLGLGNLNVSYVNKVNREGV